MLIVFRNYSLLRLGTYNKYGYGAEHVLRLRVRKILGTIAELFGQFDANLSVNTDYYIQYLCVPNTLPNTD